MRAITLCALLAVGLWGCGSGPRVLGGPGAPCDRPADCASGTCDPTASLCAEACAPGEACGEEPVCAEGDSGCSPAEPACTTGETRGDGAERLLCYGGEFVVCATMAPAPFCLRCGCEPFGGGYCDGGQGCLPLKTDGEGCSNDSQCASGICYANVGVCGPPLPMGGECSWDSECQSRNCSADGDPAAHGVCVQPLGSECEGSGRTATCTNCYRYDPTRPSVCGRAGCSETTHCPPHADSARTWTCELNGYGTGACVER